MREANVFTFFSGYLSLPVRSITFEAVDTETSFLISVADTGGAAGMRPLRVQILSFDIQIFRNVAALGVGAPLREILDPLLGMVIHPDHI